MGIKENDRSLLLVLFGQMELSVVLIVCYGVICIIAILGLVANALLIYSVLHQSSLRRSPTYITLVSLAASDFISLIGLLVFTSVFLIIGVSPAVCSLLLYAGTVTVCCSAHHLVAFSVLRYIILVKPFLSMKYLTLRRSILTCALIWTVALLFGIPIGMQVDTLPFNTSDNSTVPVCIMKQSSVPFLRTSVVVTMFVPFTVVTAFHTAKVYVLRKRTMCTENNGHRRQVSMKIVVGILVSFAITCMPNSIYWSVILQQDVSVETVVPGYITSALCFLNGAINPMFYFFFSKNARRAVSCCRRHGTEIELPTEPSPSRQERPSRNGTNIILTDISK